MDSAVAAVQFKHTEQRPVLALNIKTLQGINLVKGQNVTQPPHYIMFRKTYHTMGGRRQEKERSCSSLCHVLAWTGSGSLQLTTSSFFLLLCRPFSQERYPGVFGEAECNGCPCFLLSSIPLRKRPGHCCGRCSHKGGC